MADLKPLTLENEPTELQLQAARYLLAVNEKAGLDYCEQNGVSNETPFVFSDVSEIMQCLACFVQAGIWIGYLIDSPLWEQVLIASTDPEYSGLVSAARKLYSRECDLLLYRAAYRYGKPIIPDIAYDNLLGIYITAYPHLKQIKDRSYDDDVYPPILRDLLQASQILEMQKKPQSSYMNVTDDAELAQRERLKADLGQAKSTSVRPVLSYEDTWEFINSSDADLQFSLKVDGVNCKTCFKDGELAVALSRGRATDSLDYTDSLRKIVNLSYRGLPETAYITGECFVSAEALKMLRNKYPGKEFKTPKSTAMSMLRATHQYDERDFKHLHWLCFYGDPLGNHAGEMFDKLVELGLDTPPRILVKRSDIPKDFESFTVWLKESILDTLWEQGEALKIPSDGVVCDLLTSVQTERKDQYNDHNIALKFEQWDSVTYESVVTNVLIEQRRVFASVVLEIEPVITRDLNTATRVNVGSPAILIDDRITVGSKIKFVRKSEAINVYVRG